MAGGVGAGFSSAEWGGGTDSFFASPLRSMIIDVSEAGNFRLGRRMEAWRSSAEFSILAGVAVVKEARGGEAAGSSFCTGAGTLPKAEGKVGSGMGGGWRGKDASILTLAGAEGSIIREKSVPD